MPTAKRPVGRAARPGALNGYLSKGSPPGRRVGPSAGPGRRVGPPRGPVTNPLVRPGPPGGVIGGGRISKGPYSGGLTQGPGPRPRPRPTNQLRPGLRKAPPRGR